MSGSGARIFFKRIRPATGHGFVPILPAKSRDRAIFSRWIWKMKRPTSREADTLSRITSFRPVHVTTGEHQEAAIFPKKKSSGSLKEIKTSRPMTWLLFFSYFYTQQPERKVWSDNKPIDTHLPRRNHFDLFSESRKKRSHDTQQPVPKCRSPIENFQPKVGERRWFECRPRAANRFDEKSVTAASSLADSGRILCHRPALVDVAALFFRIFFYNLQTVCQGLTREFVTSCFFWGCVSLLSFMT